jgi:hypothetical protein
MTDTITLPANMVAVEDRIVVVRWDNEAGETDGGRVAVNGYYAELFWTPTLGPSAMFLWRRLAGTVARHRDGATLDLADVGAQLGLTAAQLGLTAARAHHAFERLERFKVVQIIDRPGRKWGVAMQAPRLRASQIERLPQSLRDRLADFDPNRDRGM